MKLKQESLNEVVLRAQEDLAQADIDLPYCCFNGGRDAWCDVGNKCVGVRCMQAFLGIDQDKCLHVGDQFLTTGNDYAVRNSRWANGDRSGSSCRPPSPTRPCSAEPLVPFLFTRSCSPHSSSCLVRFLQSVHLDHLPT